MTSRMTRVLSSAAMITVLLGAAACSSDDPKPKGGESSASQPPSSEASAPPSSDEGEATESVPPAGDTGRESIPDTQPTGFTPDDTSAPFPYDYIVDYQNQYPGWIVLSTKLPEYHADLGGYVVNVYFSAYGGSDIILRSEFTLEVDGQVHQATATSGESPTFDGWLPEKTPIGNRPDATSNFAFGDLLFTVPETSAPLVMKYNNVDGDVHIAWSPDATR